MMQPYCVGDMYINFIIMYNIYSSYDEYGKYHQ